jgi:cell division septum initiation protein DivIVA
VPPILKRAFRGYDRAQTDQVIAELTARCDALTAERAGLEKAMADLRAEQRDGKLRTDQEANAVHRELTARERQVADLEREIRELIRKHEQQQATIERLGDELLRARLDEQRHQDERAELLTRVGRIELRERVLVEQLTILKGELQQSTDPRAALDRLVETVTEEARQEAELTLKKAREHAEQIVHSAEKRGRHLGEALWTSRHTPEP